MVKHWFMLGFRLPEWQRLAGVKEWYQKLELAGVAEQAFLMANPQGGLDEANAMLLQVGSFKRRRDALAAAEQCRVALMIAAIDTSVAIDTGKSRAGPGFMPRYAAEGMGLADRSYPEGPVQIARVLDTGVSTFREHPPPVFPQELRFSRGKHLY